MTTWPSMPWSKAARDLRPNLNDSGLVGAWNMPPIDNEVVDETVGGADMTIHGACHERTLLGDALRFDGSTQYAKSSLADFRSADSQGTISLWFKSNVDGTAQRLFSSADEASNTRYLSIVISGTDYISVYQRDNDTLDIIRGGTTLLADRWYHIVLMSNGSAYSIYLDGEAESLTVASGANNGDWFADTNNRDNVTIGSMEYNAGLANPFNGLICNVEVYSDAKDSDWVAQKYAQGAHAVQGKSDWGANESVANETTDFLSNTPWEIHSGTWKVVSDTINGEECKAIECIGDGVIWMDGGLFGGTIEQAYGSWDFWWYVDAYGNYPKFCFVSDDNTGYASVGANQYALRSFHLRLGIHKLAGGGSSLMETADNYITAQTWYKINITRSAVGVFYMYANDTLVSVVNGTNPNTDTTHTTSLYLVYDADAGDKIAYSDLRGDHCFAKYLGVV